MDVLHPRCCGLDVHKSSISACILLRDFANYVLDASRLQPLARERDLLIKEVRKSQR